MASEKSKRKSKWDVAPTDPQLHQQNQKALVDKLQFTLSQSFPDPLSAEVDINDCPPATRYLLTKGSTHEQVNKETGAVVVTRGSYVPPSEKGLTIEKPLHLHISGKSPEAVRKAETMLRKMMQESLAAKKQTTEFTTQIMIRLGYGVDPDFNVVSRILGPKGSFIQHIMTEAGVGTKVILRGKESLSAPNLAGEPFHLLITSTNSAALNKAKQLSEDLLTTVYRQYDEFMASKKGHYASGYDSYYGYGYGYGYGAPQTPYPTYPYPPTSGPGNPFALGPYGVAPPAVGARSFPPNGISPAPYTQTPLVTPGETGLQESPLNKQHLASPLPQQSLQPQIQAQTQVQSHHQIGHQTPQIQPQLQVQTQIQTPTQTESQQQGIFPLSKKTNDESVKDDLKEGIPEQKQKEVSRWPSLSLVNSSRNGTNNTNPNKKIKTDAELMPPPSKAITEKLLKQIEEKRARKKSAQSAMDKEKSNESGLLKLVDYSDDDEKDETFFNRGSNLRLSTSSKASTQPFWSSPSGIGSSWKSKYKIRSTKLSFWNINKFSV